MENFNELLDKEVIDVLAKKNIIKPTPVQEKILPIINNGGDKVVVAKTGSGKTLSYLIPLITSLDLSIKTPQVVILTPTHELASQVYNEAKFLNKELNLGVEPALIIGGSNINKQLIKLKEKPRIIIGSAGRILELNKMKKLKMHTVTTIVLDEGDRLLDKVNLKITEAVIKTTLKERKLLYFSASIDNLTIDTLNNVMNNPEIIKIDNEMTIPSNINHYYFVCEHRDKIDQIRKIVNGLNLTKVMVFINNPVTIETIVAKLNYNKLKSVGLHGANKKTERKIALQQFKDGYVNILVTSDLTCRGLDIPMVECVINFDIPESTSFYQHRSGRCGRADNEGICLSIATIGEVKFINKFKKFFNINIPKKKMSYGKMVDDSNND